MGRALPAHEIGSTSFHHQAHVTLVWIFLLCALLVFVTALVLVLGDSNNRYLLPSKATSSESQSAKDEFETYRSVHSHSSNPICNYGEGIQDEIRIRPGRGYGNL